MLFGTETERTMNSVRVMNKTREAWGIHYSRTQTTRRRLRSNINDIRALHGPGPEAKGDYRGEGALKGGSHANCLLATI